MSINKWPKSERPRERLMTAGPQALSDAELLAIVLRHGNKGQNALQLARTLLQTYHGLRGIFAAPFQTLSNHAGIGPAKYAQLQAALELSRRNLQEALCRQASITKSQDAEQFILASLRACEQEVFACLFLDNQHRVIQFEKLFYGTIHSANIHPREIVKRALYHNSAAIIAAHNHPSGATEPSQADQELTKTLQKILALVDITLLDHIIVADTQTISLAQLGYLY